MDLIWLFFILSTLQPVIKQRMLEASRARMIGVIEKKRGSRVILLVHRQETMSLLGFPIMRYIDVNDAEDVMRAVELTDPEVPLDLILHTPGGLVLAAMQIARAVRLHKGKVTVFVPHYAMSGGTLIALGADEIVMSKHAVLGPVDPQLGEYPAASLLQVISEIDDKTLVLADVGKKAIAQVRTGVEELLARSMPAEKTRELAELLSTGTWTHDYPITVEHAQRMGLKASSDMPPEVLRLMSLFPQPTNRRPSVEYLPQPRRPGPVMPPAGTPR
jgi:ClpP class serine protease